MPRSTKATSRTSASSKRTSKRDVSKQRSVYAIPESPQASEASVPSESEDASRCENDLDSHSSRTTSPAPSRRGRSMSIASTKVNEDLEITPKQRTKSRGSGPAVQLNQAQLPGLEALEAVNGLYRKINDAQSEVDRLRRENTTLIRDYDSQVQSLQTDLQYEREKVAKLQQVHNKSDQEATRIAEDKLNTVLSSLQTFRLAALNLMPLLDVLTGAPDIEYDEGTEKLYEIMKEHKARSGGLKTAKPASRAG